MSSEVKSMDERMRELLLWRLETHGLIRTEICGKN